MLHQTAIQFLKDAEKSTLGSRSEAQPADRQRGMWSFLTWSFFLAQALAANEVFAKSHGDDGTNPAEADAASTQDSSAAAQSASANPLSGITGDDAGAATAAQFAAAIAAGVLTPAMWAAAGDNPVLAKALADALSGQPTADGGADMAEATAQDSNPPIDEAGPPPETGLVPDVTPLPGLLPGLEPIVTPIIGPIIEPIIDLLPVEVIADLGLELGGELLDAVDTLVGNVATTVIGSVGTLLASAVPIVGSADGILDATTGLVGGSVDAVTATLTGLVDGTLGTLTSASPLDLGSPIDGLPLPALASLTGDLDLSIGDDVASGGAIVHDLISPISSGLDVLYANGLHTDYAVELHTSTSAGDDTLHGGATADLTIAVSDMAAADLDAAADHAGQTLTKAIEALGSLGDGLA